MQAAPPSARQRRGVLEGYAAGAERAVEIAAALVSAKQSQLATLQNRLNAAAALFGAGLSGAGVYALHVAGTGGNELLMDSLKEATGAPGPELSFCAGVCWVGPEGSLTTLKGVLGV